MLTNLPLLIIILLLMALVHQTAELVLSLLNNRVALSDGGQLMPWQAWEQIRFNCQASNMRGFNRG